MQGTLDTFSLPDVLRLLATTAKTGCLRIDGDRGQGSVWLDGGGVVDAAADRAVDGTPKDEVIFELLRFDKGTFAFDADDKAPRGGRSDGVEDILRRATSLLREWNELEAVVPSLAHQVTLASDLSADEVTIDADRWKTVVAVASGRTVGELAKELRLTELGVSRVVRDLVDLGVADVAPPGRGEPAPRVEAPAERPRPAPARAPVTEPVPAIPDIPEPLTAEGQRAGWLTADKTGEVPAIPDPPDPGPLPSRVGSGRSPAATPPPAPGLSESPPVPSARNETGRTPVVRPTDTGRTPVARRPADTNGVPRVRPSEPVGPADTNRVPRVRPTEPSGPPTRSGDSRPAGRPGDAGRPSGRPSDSDRPPAERIRPQGRSDVNGMPPRPPAERGRQPSAPADRNGTPPSRRDLGTPRGPVPPTPPSPFDNGRLGPSPLGDTGQIRPVGPGSLPPDLHWAADDTGANPITGPVSSPFSGLSSQGPPRQPVGPESNEMAPHVAAMSPEARAAVQATVGNSGGSAGGSRLAPGDDAAQRGRLISFLSTVR
ncbi:MAG TPA: DUF4388 domain-containing protein [Acidimicrobiales bacterium]